MGMTLHGESANIDYDCGTAWVTTVVQKSPFMHIMVCGGVVAAF